MIGMLTSVANAIIDRQMRRKVRSLARPNMRLPDPVPSP